MEQEKIRLQKWLADCGVASRRAGEKLILSGAVEVNGEPAHIGDKIDPAHDAVTLNGEPVAKAEDHRYLMLHKPRGYITTMHDEMGRKCVAELVKDVPARLFPVGRLDRDSEGLLLMTNDGAFANAVMHPSRHVPKTYRVTVRPGITGEQLHAMSEGMELDGYRTAPARVRILEEEPGRVVLEIVLHEGRNRQIRNMCERLGLEVARLKRVAAGPVRLGMLQPGQWRELTKEEYKALVTGSATLPPREKPRGRSADRRQGAFEGRPPMRGRRR